MKTITVKFKSSAHLYDCLNEPIYVEATVDSDNHVEFVDICAAFENNLQERFSEDKINELADEALMHAESHRIDSAAQIVEASRE